MLFRIKLLNTLLILSFFLITNNYTITNPETIYYLPHEKSSDQALTFSQSNKGIGRYLAYRDIPFLIENYVKNTKTLDYGTGTGISAQFLQEQNLDVIGVDISEKMLNEAKKNYPHIPFYLIKNGLIPFVSEKFDLVFSGFVLFELGTEEEILTYLKEAKRVMKQDALLIVLIGSNDLYSKNWLCYDVKYPENKNLTSGDLAKLYLHEINTEFTDYYWNEKDYQRLFLQAGFTIIETHHPLGKAHELYEWKDEKDFSPFVIFVAKIM